MSPIYSEQYQQVIRLLRLTRQDKGLTQAQLVKALGRPQSLVAKVGNGECCLDIIEFAHIIRLLSLGPAAMLRMVLPQKRRFFSSLLLGLIVNIPLWGIQVMT